MNSAYITQQIKQVKYEANIFKTKSTWLQKLWSS